MPTLPAELLPLIVVFAPLFSKPVWEHAQVLLVGAILAPGRRTVTACLRVMGKSDEPHFQNYHRVMNRARWSAIKASQLLLRLLVTTFAPEGELIVGIDDTIERRRGEKIKAKGIYRDPVRSSHSHFVKASGLRSPLLYAAPRDQVGRLCLGVAVFDCAVPVRAILRRASSSAPKADRSCLANDPTDCPLVA
jgi:DDE superfamily endonuclease